MTATANSPALPMTIMKYSLFIYIFVFLFFSNIEGQNLITPGGLKFGNWTDTSEYSVANGREIDKGSYVIIPINTYPIIRKSNDNIFFEVSYLNGSNYIFYSKIVNDSFSVSDGIWNRFDSLGNLSSTRQYNKGIQLSARGYDAAGNLTYFDTTDYNSNISTSYQYINNRLFYKKQVSVNDNSTTYDYYPNDQLSLSNAEPSFRADFLKRPADTFKILLSAKDSTTITGVKDPNNNFSFLDAKKKLISFPLRISKGQKTVLYVLFKPSPASLRSSEQISLITGGADKKEYPIYATTYGYHLNYKTVEEISKFSLSISQDKYLVLPGMGTITTTFLTYPSGEVKTYNIGDLTKIDLSELKPGKYYINTIACNAGGSQTMILRK